MAWKVSKSESSISGKGMAMGKECLEHVGIRHMDDDTFLIFVSSQS